jgi:serpin B
VGRPLYESFTFALFRDAVQHGGGNLFLSPVSAGLALGMAYTGAGSHTRDDMARTLGFDGLAPEGVADTNARILESLRGQHDVQLFIANALWAREGVPIAPEFIAHTRRDFGAEVQTLDFRSPSALAAINDWVARNTNDKIPTILTNPLDPSLVLILTNAVYFNGKWASKFDSEKTQSRAFFRVDGSQVQRRMMTRTGEYAMASANHLAVLRLPYIGGRFSLYVLLPDSGVGLGPAYHALDAGSWDALMAMGFATRHVHVVLPRFTIRTGTSLNAALKRLGMASAFSASADFGGMMPVASTGRRLAISDVRQQTFIEVTEEGTEAAAATSVGVTATAVHREPPVVEFVADHPFAAVLRDDRTGTILFLGQVIDP